MAVKRYREVIEQEEGGDDNCLMLLCKVGEAAERESESATIGKGERVFECKTCKKKFYSFQALGGHRASHKKLRLMAADLHQALPEKPKKHACSICGLEFPLGQALGGHMRRHRPAMSPPTTNGIDKSEAVAEKAVPVPILMRSNSSKRIFGFDGGLDLNLTPDENDLKRRNIPPLFDFLHLIA